VLAYHSSLLLVSAPAQYGHIQALTQQLLALKSLLPDQAVLEVCAQQDDLMAGAQHHLGDARLWRVFAEKLGCTMIQDVSSKKTPQHTHLLRTAHKVCLMCAAGSNSGAMLSQSGVC
jgi:hypothetical protein